MFEDNEAVIKMIMKGRSPTMKHFPELIELLLICCSIELILTQKNQIKYIDTKNQLKDIITKKNFTRDEWNHLLYLFNMNHFSFIACIAAKGKRVQQRSGEERVTAKSRPMMNSTASLIKLGEDLVWISRSGKICSN